MGTMAAKGLGSSQLRYRNQITLPPRVRKRLGIEEGDIVAFFDTPDGVLIVKAELVIVRPDK